MTHITAANIQYVFPLVRVMNPSLRKEKKRAEIHREILKNSMSNAVSRRLHASFSVITEIESDKSSAPQIVFFANLF